METRTSPLPPLPPVASKVKKEFQINEEEEQLKCQDKRSTKRSEVTLTRTDIEMEYGKSETESSPQGIK